MRKKETRKKTTGFERSSRQGCSRGKRRNLSDDKRLREKKGRRERRDFPSTEKKTTTEDFPLPNERRKRTKESSSLHRQNFFSFSPDETGKESRRGEGGGVWFPRLLTESFSS